MNFPISNRLFGRMGHVPSQNFGVAVAKNFTFSNTTPYVLVGDVHGEVTVDFSFHFIKNLRRILSGVTGDHRFTAQEERLYQNYMSWLVPVITVINQDTSPKVFYDKVRFTEEVHFIGHFIFKQDATFSCGYITYPNSSVTFEGVGLDTSVCFTLFTDEDIAVMIALDQRLVKEVMGIKDHKMLRAYSRDTMYNTSSLSPINSFVSAEGCCVVGAGTYL